MERSKQGCVLTDEELEMLSDIENHLFVNVDFRSNPQSKVIGRKNYYMRGYVMQERLIPILY